MPAEILERARERTKTGSSNDEPGCAALVISSTPAPPTASGAATLTRPVAVGALTVATVHGGGGPPPDPEPVPPGRRGDLPVRRDVRRKRSALEAALAEHRQEALADLDENVVAWSRVRTCWVDLCQASLGPFRWRRFATSRRRCVGAATALPRTTLMRRWRTKSGSGSGRSTHCSRRRCGATPGQSCGVCPAAGSRRSSQVDRLTTLVTVHDGPAIPAWSPWTSAHAADAFVLAAWFMLREIEFAAARTQDLRRHSHPPGPPTQGGHRAARMS